MLISIPVYGKRYTELFFDTTLPRLEKELQGGQGGVDFHIHTDRPKDILKRLPKAHVTLVPEGGDDYGYFSEGHRLGWEKAKVGEIVFFYCADLIVSEGAFRFAIETLKTRRAVVSWGLRVTEIPPEDSEDCGDLLEFGLNHLHPIMTELFWGKGRCTVPYCVFFQNQDSLVLRAFHLHPFAVVKIPGKYQGTVDRDLLDLYPRQSIHLVEREMVMLDITSDRRTLGVENTAFGVRELARFSRERCSILHRWFFEHPIRIRGEKDCGDKEVANAIHGYAGSFP